MLCNFYAQRSRNDLTNYPVFPWVIKEFQKEVLELANPQVYRDLSKPIGALNPIRLQEFEEKYADMPEGFKSLYSTHYSCMGTIIEFNLRSNPKWMIAF